MSTFELIIVILAFIYVSAAIFLGIRGIIVGDKRYLESKNWEDQIRVLTVRIGEVSTQNNNLANDLRSWKEAYVALQLEAEKYKASADEYKNKAKESDAKYLDLKRDFEKLTTMERKD